VLACGFTALLGLSGDWSKLAALTNLSGTNLDAEDARRVSGRDATNQFPSCPIRSRSAGNPQGEHGLAFFGSFFDHAKNEQWALVHN